jgi:dihydrofolate synthase/folylpolyglutamate synthase
VLADTVKKRFTNQRIIYIIGVLADKDYKRILDIMSRYSKQVITVTPHNPRALPAKQLAKAAEPFYETVYAAGDCNEAVVKAKEWAGTKGVVLAFGSLSYLREIAQGWNEERGF